MNFEIGIPVNLCCAVCLLWTKSYKTNRTLSSICRGESEVKQRAVDGVGICVRVKRSVAPPFGITLRPNNGNNRHENNRKG